jgi:PAS domain-containing protein
MVLNYLPYGILALSLVMTLGLLPILWRRRPAPGIMPLLVLLAAVSVWNAAYLMEMASTTIPTMKFWVSVEYFGIVTIPGAWLIFAMAYTHKEQWITRRNVLLLTIEPLLVLLATWTNDWHGLFRANQYVSELPGFTLLMADMQALFWIHTAYSYILLMAGAVLFVRMFIQTRAVYRGQVFAIMIAIVAPWAGNAAYLFLNAPIDLTSIGFSVSGLAMTIGLFRYRLMDIRPIARNAILENLDAMVAVVDTRHRIVDLNPAIRRVIDDYMPNAIGRPLADVLPAVAASLEPSLKEAVDVCLNRLPTRVFSQQSSRLLDRREMLQGWMIVLYDITDRKQVELALRDSEDRYRSLFESAFEGLAIHRDGSILDVNPAFEALFGYSRSDAIGRSAIDFSAPESRALMRQYIRIGADDPIEGKRPARGRDRILLRDSRQRPDVSGPTGPRRLDPGHHRAQKHGRRAPAAAAGKSAAQPRDRRHDIRDRHGHDPANDLHGTGARAQPAPDGHRPAG